MKYVVTPLKYQGSKDRKGQFAKLKFFCVC